MKYFSSIVPYLALVISVVSIIVSFRSYRISENNFTEDRTPIWKINIDSAGYTANLTEARAEFIIQKATGILPDGLSKKNLNLNQQRRSFGLINFTAPLICDLKIYLDSEDGVLPIMSGRNKIVPFVLNTDYTVKGQLRHSSSLYHFKYSFLNLGTTRELPFVKIDYADFVRHLSPDENSKELLKSEWEKHGIFGKEYSLEDVNRLDKSTNEQRSKEFQPKEGRMAVLTYMPLKGFMDEFTLPTDTVVLCGKLTADGRKQKIKYKDR